MKTIQRIQKIHKAAKCLEELEFPNKIENISVTYKGTKVIVKADWFQKPFPFSQRQHHSTVLFYCNSKGEITIQKPGKTVLSLAQTFKQVTNEQR